MFQRQPISYLYFLDFSKQGKIRDRGDEMAKSTIEYATTDLSTMQVGLDSFGRSIANVQEYRNAYLHSIDASVITPIYAFDRECKDARAELNKLEKDQRKYEKTLKNPVSFCCFWEVEHNID